MRFRVFTLAFGPATERFNDEAVREYLADKDVQSVADHFFMKDGTPYLVLVACYRLRPLAPPVEAETKAGRQRDESWRDTLAKEDWPLFNTLRGWRGERARSEGIPSYVIAETEAEPPERVGRKPLVGVPPHD